MLQWAHDNGCPWSMQCCTDAATAGKLSTLQWLRKQGCPWNEDVCHGAVGGGHLEVLQWAVANGCPMYEHYCLICAAYKDDVESLRFLLRPGCDWIVSVARRLAASTDPEVHALVVASRIQNANDVRGPVPGL